MVSNQVQDKNCWTTRSSVDSVYRYLTEIQLFMVAERAFKSLMYSIEDKTSLLYGECCGRQIGLYERTGRTPRGIALAKKDLEIKEAKHIDKNDLANSLSDVGYLLIASYYPEESILYLNRALNIAEQEAEPDLYRKFNIDRFLRNRGRAYMQLGDYGAALKDFSRAEYFQEKIYGKQNHFDGE